MIKKTSMDIEVVNATPITCEGINVSSNLEINILRFTLGKSTKTKVRKGDTLVSTSKRPLLYYYNNGKTSEVGVLTYSVSKQDGSTSIKKCLVSYKDTIVTQYIKEYLKDKDLVTFYKTLSDYKKLKKNLHTSEERLLALVIENGKKKYILTDRRKDLENMANVNKNLKYKIISEKYGYYFSNKTKKLYQNKYPKCSIEDIETITSDKKVDPRTAYIEIAKLLVKKTKTPQKVKVDAKRLLSRVRGDYIWDSGM